MILRMAAAAALALLTSACAQIQSADGKTVAVRHMYQAPMPELQKAADVACVQSGGRAPATYVSSVPVAQVAVQLSDWIYNFRCAQ